MKWLTSDTSKWLWLLAMVLIALPGRGEVKANDSLQSKTDSIEGLRYEKHLQRYQRIWRHLIPNHGKIQYAGSIGAVSVGMGWHYGPHHHVWESDLYFGFLPKFDTRTSKLTMTIKQSYVPFRIPVWHDISVEPLSCGLFFNTVFAEDFWAHQPSKYPKKYYGFSTKIRTNIFVGQRIRFNIPSRFRKRHNSISLYYELSTCDLYLASYATNSYLSLWDILSLALGVKLDVF